MTVTSATVSTLMSSAVLLALPLTPVHNEEATATEVPR